MICNRGEGSHYASNHNFVSFEADPRVRKSVKIEWRLCRRGFRADEDEETKSLDINIDDKNIPSV